MAMRINGDDSGGINEINITPFVDIVLVLLIFFMISTPAMVYRGLTVSLPKTVSGEDISHVTLKLTLTRDGALYLDKRPIRPDELGAIVEKLKKNRGPTDALLSADKEVPHGRVMEISDRLRTLGISQIGFASQKS